jgi:hypothetical protein
MAEHQVGEGSIAHEPTLGIFPLGIAAINQTPLPKSSFLMLAKVYRILQKFDCFELWLYPHPDVEDAIAGAITLCGVTIFWVTLVLAIAELLYTNEAYY